MLYVCVVMGTTLIAWRNSLAGLVAVCQMAAGDGLADIFGRKWGRVKWPFSKAKSYAGSAAFVVGGTIVSLAVVQWFVAFGCLGNSTMALGGLTIRLAFISVVCAMIELVPFGDDNLTVPMAAVILTRLLFPHSLGDGPGSLG